MNTATMPYLESLADKTAESIRKSLQQMPYRDIRSLSVAVEHDAIVLSGSLDSFYHKQIVQNRLAFAYRSLEVVDQTIVNFC